MMNRQKILPLVFMGVSWWMVASAVSLAVDVAVKTDTVNEAISFFSQLVHTSKNPLIAQMAQDDLRKISAANQTIQQEINTNLAPQLDSSKSLTIQETFVHSKTPRESTVVTLMPQNDSTYVVPALINQKTMATFLIDTGASYTVITPQMAQSLGIRINRDNPTVPVTTANGILHAPVVHLKQVCLGSMRVNDVDAVVTELGSSPQISGLLGMSFFRGMDLSFHENTLSISR